MSIHREQPVFLGIKELFRKRRKQGNGQMGRTYTKKKQSKICTVVILVSLLLLGTVVLIRSLSLREQKAELAVQAAELTEQIEEAKDAYAELEEKEEYMKTKKYVEEVARNQLGLVYPDEIVIRPEE